MPRSYPAIHIRFTPEAEVALELRDRLLAGLDDFSPTALEEAAAVWRVFFESAASRDRALAWLRALGDDRLTADPVDVDDEDWARRSQADLQPVRVGQVIVSPPWCAEQARRSAGSDDLLAVVLPSTGFGTGHHASTRLCLALLQEIGVRDRRVLDIGTGSGVLAIAAAGLGAASVIAIDNDPDAIEAARENVGLNGYAGRVALQVADLEGLRIGPADIVVANLTGELLRREAPNVVRCAAAQADLVLSGVLAEERDGVVAAFEAAGTRLRAARTEDEWVGLLLVVPA